VVSEAEVTIKAKDDSEDDGEEQHRAEDQKDDCGSAGLHLIGQSVESTQKGGGKWAAVAWLLTKPDAEVFIRRLIRDRILYAQK